MFGEMLRQELSRATDGHNAFPIALSEELFGRASPATTRHETYRFITSSSEAWTGVTGTLGRTPQDQFWSCVGIKRSCATTYVMKQGARIMMNTRLIFRNFRFLNPRLDALQDGMELLVEDGRVKEISSHSIRIPSAEVIDLGGKTLMPGLIDAHVHIFYSEKTIADLRDVPQTYVAAKATFVLRGMLMRGFTTIRDVAGGDYGMRDAISAGYVDGPRLYMGGRAISQTGGHGDFRAKVDQAPGCECCTGLSLFSRLADGIPEVVKAVREELRLGADHIKLMLSGGVASPNDPLESQQFRDDEILAAVDEATRWGVYVAAHAYSDDAVRRAVSFGVRTIEHGNFLSRETAKLMASSDVFLIPTLITYHVMKVLGEKSGKSAITLEKNDKVYDAGYKALEICRDEGVSIGFGSDLSSHFQDYQCDGLSLQAQVTSNAEVIRSATIINASVLKQSGLLGELIPGAKADILILNGNPYEDLSIFDSVGSNICAILKEGIFYKDFR